MQIGKLTIITVACVIGAAAQDKVTVPLTNPAQPATIKASMISGSITVTAGSGRDIVVSSSDGDTGRKPPKDKDVPPPGMTRIGGRPGLDIEEDHNVVTISAGSMTSRNGANLTIEVPVNTNLELRTINGPAIDVTGVNGDLEIENTNGSIKLTNVSGSVVAHTLNGGVTVSMDRITGNKPMSFTSMNGKVDVTLPADTKARLRLKSDNGSIFSDFDVKLEPDSNKPVVEDTRPQNGKYKISIDRAVTGTINGGGPEYTFQTMNGNILIHKK
jgi:DUF4097 and DUF4098 domain-containing protein YvlB